MNEGLLERLRRQAERSSDIGRQMAEAKSLRQESNEARRTDLYMWPKPEQTLEWEAATEIERLSLLVEEARNCCEQIELLSTNHGAWFEHDPWKWGQMMGDHARTLLAKLNGDEK